VHSNKSLSTRWKILFVNVNGKIGREGVFKPTIIGNDSLHETNDDTGVKEVNFATSENLVIRCTMFLPTNIYKYTSPDGKTHKR
jgi:hypothetical protein